MRLVSICILLLLAFATGCAGAQAKRPEVRIGQGGNSPAPASEDFTRKPSAGSALPQDGKASFYGPGFAGKPTASGEIFDPRAMTAAHPSLPFGTRVRVTAPEYDNKSVVVKINDRFPGTKGRIIDLSEAAFEKLAPKARGEIRVRLERAK